MMRHFHQTLLILGLLQGVVQAQQIDFHFQLYKADATIADALQSRLIEGGEPAELAMSKMPDFVRQRRVELEAELKIQTPSGQRAKSASSQRMLEVDDDWEVVDGIQIELDPVLDASSSMVDLNIHAEYSVKDGSAVKMHRLTTASLVKVGTTSLLSRWQEEDEILLLLGTASLTTPPGTPSEDRRLIFVECTIYGSDIDAQAKRNPLTSIVFPSRSGQRAKCEITIPFAYEYAGSQTYTNLGYAVEIDPVIGADGKTVDINAAVFSAEKRSGSERLADGSRIPRVDILTSRPTASMIDGDSNGFDINKSTLGGAPPTQDPAKAVLGIKIQSLQ
ncbi:MAG: hypothetical protein AAGH89_07960 [Verrucomicrobiota bacterium]